MAFSLKLSKISDDIWIEFSRLAIESSEYDYQKKMTKVSPRVRKRITAKLKDIAYGIHLISAARAFDIRMSSFIKSPPITV